MADLLSKVVVPVADADVAETTARAAREYLNQDSRIVAVHVLQDDEYASKDEWETFAEDAFERTKSVLGEDRVETELREGDDVTETIFEVAKDVDASAVAFRSRGGSRWRQIMAGDVARELVTEPDVPIVVLPGRE
ncbi:MAG: universal stress protein [Halobacteriales archaeon]